MAIRKIAQLGEPILRRRAEEVPPDLIRAPDLQRLIDDMIETMHDADGAGLAAPQIYESLRLCVIEVANNPRYPQLEPIPLTVLINPIVSPRVSGGANAFSDDDAIIMYEGCLSVQGLRGRVRRPGRVQVTAQDRLGQALDFTWEGLRAAVVQHETDHLDGVLFVDRADSRSLTFLREYERHVPLAERVLDRGAKLK
ncbi:MAG TPA: peptide deformylase [Polyangiaceae bacterium]|nr:peptide deformylase [Polyangiaceae bacterium]